MEEEAQKLAQAMAPLIQASENSNGQPPRKLHRDTDMVGNASEEIERDIDIYSRGGDGSRGHLANSHQ